MKQVAFAEFLGISQGTLSEWESGTQEPSPLALAALGRMDYENATWWYEQAGPRFAERLKLQGVIREVRAEIKEAREERVDPDLLAWILQALDSASNLIGVVLPLKKYARIVAAVYDECQESGERDAAMVEQAVRAACAPSNEKVR
jgi:transcriptional regulator with XRE-family HTH domain